MGIGDFFRDLFGGDDESRGFRNAEQIIANIQFPELQELVLELGRMVEDGELTPQLAETYFVNATGFDDIQLDPELQAQQMRTLQRLEEISEAGGLDAQAMARIREAQAMEDTRLRGDLEAIETAARRRGDMTAGMDYTNQLLAAQQSANRMSARGFDEAALAEQRALEAMMRGSEMAAGMQDADFQRQAQRAQAQDVINRFNTQNRQNVQNQNVDRINTAQQYNLDRDRERQEFNLGQQRQEEMSRVQGVGDLFAAREAQARSQANLRAGRGAAEAGEESRRRDNIGDAIKAAGAFLFSDRDMKENVRPFNIDEFLTEMTGYRFDYKNGGEEDVSGVMTDDLKQSEMGRDMVREAPNGYEMVDEQKALSGALASLAELNDRVKKIEGGY